MTDPYATAVAAKTYVRRLGGAFMKNATTSEHASAAGLRGFPYYFGGRGFVVGAVAPDVAASLFPFFRAEFVREQWHTAAGGRRAREVGDRYVESCRDWGRRQLARFGDAGRLAELMEAVARNADVTAGALFAGWRAVPLPDDAAARVAQLAHVLREQRGGFHLAGVLASGLTPLQAVLARDRGPERARFLHWPEPYPVLADDVVARRHAAEELTDRMAAPAYGVLDEDEAAELVALLEAAYRVALG